MLVKFGTALLVMGVVWLIMMRATRHAGFQLPLQARPGDPRTRRLHAVIYLTMVAFGGATILVGIATGV